MGRSAPLGARDEATRRSARSLGARAAGEARLRAWLHDLTALTKPRITALVLATAAAGFLVAGAAGGAPALGALLLGTALLAAGTNALNQVLEHEADARMERTRNRPVPAGRMRPSTAGAFGMSLVGVGAGVLFLWVNAVTGALGLASALLYVAAYTPLKRRSAVSLLVGAVPGALPALGGWTAATARVDAGGLALFGLLFVWQLPHFLALGWLHREDYRRAGFAVLAVDDPTGARSGEAAVFSALALLPVSLLPTLLGVTGWLYAAAALVAGVAYLAAAVRFAGPTWEEAGPIGREEAGTTRGDGSADARRAGHGRGTGRGLFRASLLYLPVVLAAAVVDAALGVPGPDPEFLPGLNAGLNALAAVALVVGVVLVRRGRVRGHRAAMIAAASASAVFLGSYLVHHARVGPTAFEGEGWIRDLYFPLLASHTVLAAIVVPLAVLTVSRILRGRAGGHRRLARWTFPVWLYVSATGIVIYLLVYGP